MSKHYQRPTQSRVEINHRKNNIQNINTIADNPNNVSDENIRKIDNATAIANSAAKKGLNVAAKLGKQVLGLIPAIVSIAFRTSSAIFSSILLGLFLGSRK